MISIVTGTLNRKHLLKKMINNTVETSENLELVLVDGGSIDGTVDYLKSVNHKRIKLIEVGKRSSYPHFMNLGISHASHNLICQWNDDVLFLDSWDDLIKDISKDEADAYLFGWQSLSQKEIEDKELLNNVRWNILNEKPSSPAGEIVMNYGIYKKHLFDKFGGYDTNFVFYYADGELSHRFYHKGARFKNCYNYRVATLKDVPRSSSVPSQEEFEYYQTCLKRHLTDDR